MAGIKVLEKDVLKACMDFLSTVPHSTFFRRNTGATISSYKGRKRIIRYGQKRACDIYGVREGQPIEIEVKAPGKKPTEDQLLYMERMRSVGCLVYCVSSVDELMEAFR